MRNLFGHPQIADTVQMRLPRWLIDDRFDAAMALRPDDGWRDELPALGLKALLVPGLALMGWALILWGVTRLW